MQADGRKAITSSPSAFSQPSSLDLPPPTIPDHQLLCLIGRGAYGEVWLARNAISTPRAVKIVHRQSFQRAEHFEREFNGLLKFEPISRSHDGLVDILQIGRRDDAGYFFYVMELADAAKLHSEDRRSKIEDSKGSECGTCHLPSSILHPQNYAPHTLRSELQTRGHVPPAECVAVGLKLAAALEHLHANGLVHRDIKPSNIIFVNGEPKLADIGLVTAIDEAHSLVGTVGYIPPEGPGTPQADLYSLGKVLYEIAFGKDRQDFPQLPPDLQSHPDYAALLELNEVILKACESDPRRRYANAAALSKDLDLLQRGHSVKRHRLWQRRRGAIKRLGLAAAVLALLAIAFHFLKGSKRGHTPSPEAAQEYELGRWFYQQLTPEAHTNAFYHLNRAVQLDPKFVQPYGELTALYVWGQPGLFASQEERILKTKEIADKLMAIDPNSAEGHTALSWYKFLNQDWVGAEEEIVRAISLNGKYPIAHDIYGFYLSLLGRTGEAMREGQLAQALAPTARTTALVAASPFFAARQFDLAIAQAERAVKLEKHWAEAHNFIGRCYEAQSNYVAAIEVWKNYDLLAGRDPARVAASYDALRQAYDTEGEQGYLRKYIELIRENEALPESEQIFFIDDIAGYYARLGENDKALDEIEKQFDRPHVRAQLKYEPMYDTLHDEPRFKALLKKAGLEK